MRDVVYIFLISALQGGSNGFFRRLHCVYGVHSNMCSCFVF